MLHTAPNRGGKRHVSGHFWGAEDPESSQARPVLCRPAARQPMASRGRSAQGCERLGAGSAGRWAQSSCCGWDPAGMWLAAGRPPFVKTSQRVLLGGGLLPPVGPLGSQLHDGPSAPWVSPAGGSLR